MGWGYSNALVLLSLVKALAVLWDRLVFTQMQNSSSRMLKAFTRLLWTVFFAFSKYKALKNFKVTFGVKCLLNRNEHGTVDQVPFWTCYPYPETTSC